MKRQSTVTRDFLIGLVFLGALAVFGWGTLRVLSPDVFGLSRSIDVPFTEVNDIHVGDDVRFHGYSIGIVTAVKPQFDAREKLMVTCRIKAPGVVLPEDSRFVVRSSSPLGGKYVDVVRGEDEKVIAIEQGAFSGASENDLFNDVSRLVDQIRQGNGLLHQVIHNQSAGEDFSAFMSEIRQITERINKSDGGILGMLINDPATRESFRATIENIEKISRSLNEGEGTLALLMNDTETRDRVKAVIANLEEFSRKATTGQGTLARLLNEDSLHLDLEETIAGIKTFVTDMNEGNGSLKMLASDAEFKNDLKVAVAGLKSTLSSINDGEGTFGQLVKNREAYDQLMRILDNVADAVEDFREQAPISTFVNAVFSGL